MSDALTKQDLDHFARELRRLLRHATGTSNRVRRESLDMGGGGLDTQGDAGSEAEFEEVDLDSMEVEGAVAEATVAALRRVVDGTYGRCTECGVWIPRGRLEVVPYTSRCVSCRAIAEGQP